MSPADSPARDQAVANLTAHGPLGAALADIKAAQQSLAETRTSLLNSVRAHVLTLHERDEALALVEAVRALCDEAESTTWAVPMVSAQRLRAALAQESTS